MYGLSNEWDIASFQLHHHYIEDKGIARVTPISREPVGVVHVQHLFCEP